MLLGINAHVNYDLPQALLAVISDADFADPAVLARRQRDHEAIDAVLASRVAAEDDQLSVSGGRSLLDRVLQPLNRLSLQTVPARGPPEGVAQHPRAPGRPAGRPGRRTPSASAELEVLSAARVADLLAPGQVLLRLAVSGFGVVLPPPA